MSDKQRQKNSPQALPLSPLWSVREEAFQTALSALVERDTSVSAFSAYYDRDEELAAPKPYEVVNGVALVPLTGVLTRDRGWWSWLFGGTSIVQQRLDLMMAAQDEEVESILLYAYSPGGEVYGIADFADAVVEARKKKKVWAYAADECCSACYWAICRAERIIANSTAIVGSIGIMQVVEDWSAAYRKQGVKVKVFKSGEYKGAGVPGTSMTEEQEAETQRLVDAMADQFFEAVSTGRKLSDDQMETIATGQVWIGREALDMGLVDEIGTLEGALARLAPKEPATANNGMRRYGAQNTTPPTAGKQETSHMNWREKLAAALAKLGLHSMAGLVLGAQEDNMDALAQQLQAQVTTEAQAQIAAHPLIGPLATAGVTTSEQLAALIQQAQDGKEVRQAVQSRLNAAGVRLYKREGVTQEAVDSIVAAYKFLPLAQMTNAAEQWEKEADKLFGTNKTEPAKRQTAPTALTTVATDAHDPQESPLSEAERKNVRQTAEAAAGGGRASRNGQG